MKKGFVSVIALFLTVSLLSAAADQSKKTYELIYDDLQRLAQQVLDLERKIDQNTESIKTISLMLEEILLLNQRFLSEQASLKEDQKQIPPQIQIVLSRLDTLSRNLGAFAGELAEIKSIVLAPPGVPAEEQTEENPEGQLSSPKKTNEQKSAEDKNSAAEAEGGEAQSGDPTREQFPVQELPRLSPQEVFDFAYADYLKGYYQLAIDGFTLYLLQFSDSPVADDAAYWIGECHFSQENFEEAITQFNEMILNYPTGDKIPAAYLKKGISLMELEKKEEAFSVFTLLINKYPYEAETRIAQEKIKEIRKHNA